MPPLAFTAHVVLPNPRLSHFLQSRIQRTAFLVNLFPPLSSLVHLAEEVRQGRSFFLWINVFVLTAPRRRGQARFHDESNEAFRLPRQPKHRLRSVGRARPSEDKKQGTSKTLWHVDHSRATSAQTPTRQFVRLTSRYCKPTVCAPS